MQKHNLFRSLLGAMALGLAFSTLIVMHTGCELESASSAGIRISPSYAEVQRLQSVALTASGWTDYRWRLSRPEIGTLSSSVGESVVYTATRSGSIYTNETDLMIQIVTAEGITQGSTNNSGLTATAQIRHR